MRWVDLPIYYRLSRLAHPLMEVSHSVSTLALMIQGLVFDIDGLYVVFTFDHFRSGPARGDFV